MKSTEQLTYVVGGMVIIIVELTAILAMLVLLLFTG
jgi:hypothetical protein